MPGAQTPAEILTRYEDAIARRDADAVVADYVDDALAFDLAPPLQQVFNPAEAVGGIRDWLETWEDDLRVTHAEPTLLEEGDIAMLWCLQHMTGTKKGEAPSSLWFRSTLALRRVAGAWKIVHIHTSVPFAMDGSGKALLDLEP